MKLYGNVSLSLRVLLNRMDGDIVDHVGGTKKLPTEGKEAGLGLPVNIGYRFTSCLIGIAASDSLARIVTRG